jgi:UDPglucose--hexose-1-phosphate uridylyltransferase
MTPPEIFVKRQAGEPNTPGWSLRVVANKFPALKIEGELDREAVGMFDMMNGVGAHEVIIETPDHTKELSQLEEGQIEQIIWAYITRSLDLRKDKRFQYILLFKNHGKSAGASLSHSHTQLIALPMIPKSVQEELGGAEHYFNYKERCAYCDMARQEELYGKNVISSNDTYIAFCPYVARFPFETWIMPKEHFAAFDYLEPMMVTDLAKMLKFILARIRKVLKEPSYNFIIHSSPIEEKIREEYHWHIEIIPKLSRTAGFEWGSGFYINPTPSELAAKYLRGGSRNGNKNRH